MGAVSNNKGQYTLPDKLGTYYESIWISELGQLITVLVTALKEWLNIWGKLFGKISKIRKTDFWENMT